jgi:hypothetical protein
MLLSECESSPAIWPLANATESDTALWLMRVGDLVIDRGIARGAPRFAYLEQCSAMPWQGRNRRGSVANFLVGYSYGFLRGLLIAFKIPFETVRPAKWQRALGCLSHGDKNVTKAKAQELFPSIKCTHAISDALLIAEYGRRQRLGLHRKTQEPLSQEGEG